MNIWLIISIILYVLQVVTGILYFKNRKLRDEYEKLLKDENRLLTDQNHHLNCLVQALENRLTLLRLSNEKQ